MPRDQIAAGQQRFEHPGAHGGAVRIVDGYVAQRDRRALAGALDPELIRALAAEELLGETQLDLVGRGLQHFAEGGRG